MKIIRCDFLEHDLILFSLSLLFCQWFAEISVLESMTANPCTYRKRTMMEQKQTKSYENNKIESFFCTNIPSSGKMYWMELDLKMNLLIRIDRKVFRLHKFAGGKSCCSRFSFFLFPLFVCCFYSQSRRCAFSFILSVFPHGWLRRSSSKCSSWKVEKSSNY